MKLSKSMKKFLAVLTAVALVVTSAAFYNVENAKGEVDPSTLNYKQYTIEGGPDLYYAEVVPPSIVGWATPAYLDGGRTFQLIFSADNLTSDTKVKVNGVETSSGVVYFIGLGIVKLDPSLMQDNAYTHVEVTATTGSADIYFKRGNPTPGPTTTVDPSQPTTEEPTTEEPTTEEPTTETPSIEPTTETPTEQPTTSGDIVMDKTFDPGTGELTEPLGGYSIYVGGWDNSKAIGGVDAANPDHIKVQHTSSNWYDAWAVQIIKEISGLNSSETYTVEWPIKAANNDGKVKTDFTGDQEIPLTGAAQTLSGTKDSDASGNLNITVGMGWVGLANPVEYMQPIVKDSQGKQVYPKGEEPTTEEPTTETPTEEPTTEAPQPTTVAPQPTSKVTPTTKKVVKKPGKASIKKIYKKKKSAKKLKLKLKKVKGANGYQVAVYKTKKNAKKNKKALVKKYTKKLKFTIKSKKLKNKKKLYVKARAYALDGKKKVFGKWSKVEKAKIKK